MHAAIGSRYDGAGDTDREPRADATRVPFERVLKRNHKPQPPQIFP